MPRHTKVTPAAAVLAAAALISACAAGGSETLVDAAPPSAGASSPSVAECAWVDYNADYPAGTPGSATPRQAVESWLAEQFAEVHAAAALQDTDGLRYTAADGRPVAELSATQADDGTWLLSSGSVCPAYLQRR
jgi:hypothetical protein